MPGSFPHAPAVDLPVAQGCRIAGLKVPRGAIDKGFGSVA